MPPAPATERLHRLLVMIPWLTARGRVHVDELARAFDVTRDQAEADVLLASMVGVPPYEGGCNVDMFLDDDGYVEAFPQPYLVRPPQLTAAQGFALLAAGRALLDVDDSPLATALAKLEQVLGDPNVVSVPLGRPEHLDAVRAAVDDGTQLQITYYAAWRDELTERAIEPRVVFQRNGRWYVEAHCHRAGDLRRFRIDRIRALAPTGERFDPVRADPPTDVFDPGAEAQQVVLDIPASARWVIESYPVTWEERDGRLRVTMRVLGTPWLERLLLKLGADAHVVEPAELRSVGADAARRLLDAYDG